MKNFMIIFNIVYCTFFGANLIVTKYLGFLSFVPTVRLHWFCACFNDSNGKKKSLPINPICVSVFLCDLEFCRASPELSCPFNFFFILHSFNNLYSTLKVLCHTEDLQELEKDTI